MQTVTKPSIIIQCLIKKVTEQGKQTIYWIWIHTWIFYVNLVKKKKWRKQMYNEMELVARCANLAIPSKYVISIHVCGIYVVIQSRLCHEYVQLWDYSSMYKQLTIVLFLYVLHLHINHHPYQRKQRLNVLSTIKCTMNSINNSNH